MAKFRITGPDGATYDVTAPDGATEAEVMNYVRQNAGGQSSVVVTPEGSAHVRQAETPPLAGRIGRGLLRGVRDPIDAGAQMLVRGVEAAIPDSWTGLDQWAKGEVARVEGINKDAEGQYQESRGSSAGTFDPSRLGGGLVASLPIAALAPAGGTLAARTALGAATGAGLGTLTPVHDAGDDFWSRKAKQAGTGAAFGAAAAPVAGAISRVIRPKTSPEVRSLMREGVTPTPGQVLGGAWRTTEDKLTSIPLVGDAIRAGQSRGIEQFNRAAVNRSLFSIGKTLPKGVVGREAIEFAEDALKQSYDDVLAKVGTPRVDNQMLSELANLKQIIANQPKDFAGRLERVIDNEILARTSGGRMTGEAIKAAESNLGSISRGLRGSADYDTMKLGEAVNETQRILRSWLERSAPKAVSDQLRRTNAGWADFKRVQRAAASVGNDGVFTPAQLHSAVKALDRSKDKAAFARGNAPMQDLSSAGRSVLASRVPDSGTPGRLMAAATAGGLGYLSPTALAGAGLASLPYAPGVQRGVAGLLASRPAFAEPLAEGVRAAGTPVITAGLLRLLNQ